MALPKRKTSKARKRSRAANWKITAVGLSECPKCHEPVMSHKVCSNCGYYDGKQVIEIKEKKAE